MSLGGLGNNYVFKGDFITARKYYKEYFEKSPEIGGKLTALNFIANSYLYEGNTDSALIAFEEYRKFVEKENSRINLVNYYTNVGYVLDETGKPASATGYYDKVEELSKELKIPVEIQESIKVNSMISHLNNLIALKELEKAKPELDKCIKDIETRNNPTEKMGINMISGYYAVQKGSWDDALGYLSKADNQNPRTWYYCGVAYKNKGDIPNAKKCFTKVAEYNVNTLDLALLRNRAKMELKE
jgi:tetratricopeptide (TPR) repeat protein